MSLTSGFAVELIKEQLVFSAAHFITFGDNICESLHGHNYGVRCTVRGPLNQHGYVVDFIALRDSLASLVKQLDHRVLLPDRHPTIRVEAGEQEVTVRFEERRWVFPSGDCRILPVPNTTAEWLAEYLAEQLRKHPGNPLRGVEWMAIGVDENHGQWGWSEHRLDPAAG